MRFVMRRFGEPARVSGRSEYASHSGRSRGPARRTQSHFAFVEENDASGAGA